jgi:hypothetical protein
MIRRSLHPQLKSLCETHPTLQRLIGAPHSTGRYLPIEARGYQLFPIVQSSLHMVCAIDILFLRKEAPGELILQGGDIDNRIKTLFDALRMPDPAKPEEMPDHEMVDAPKPMYFFWRVTRSSQTFRSIPIVFCLANQNPCMRRI